MTKREKLLDKARRSPAGLRFEEICQLAEYSGFVFARQRGTSHRLYKHPRLKDVLNFQDDHGMAKEYQVKQLLSALEEIRELESNEENEGT